MSHLVAVVFDEKYKAAEAQIALWRLRDAGRIQLEDSAYVIKSEKGEISVHQQTDVVKQRATQFHYVGLLAGIVTGLGPLALVGTAAGAMIGKLTDKIDDGFIKSVGKTLAPGGSALFARGTRLKGEPGENIAHLSALGGKVFHTTIADEEEAAAVRNALEGGGAK